MVGSGICGRLMTLAAGLNLWLQIFFTFEHLVHSSPRRFICNDEITGQSRRKRAVIVHSYFGTEKNIASNDTMRH
jgi:hypothetical protein